MKYNNIKCIMCDEKIVIDLKCFDINNVPETCSKDCHQNREYQKATRNKRTGEVRSPEEIRTWKKD